MRYQRLAPDPSLAGLVEHYWVVVAPALPQELRAVLVPNGRATVQLCLGDPGTRYRPGSAVPETNANVYLPVTADPFVIAQSGPSHYVGVQLTATGARTLWPHSPSSPTPVTAVAADRPADDALRSDPKRALDQWLQQEAARSPASGPGRELAEAAVALIDQDPAAVTVREVSAAVSASTATLYRAFVRWVGVGPKAYMSIRRYDAFTSALLAQSHGDSRAMLAAAAGYADEAHAARDFRRHTGVNAAQFRERLDGIAAHMFERHPSP